MRPAWLWTRKHGTSGCRWYARFAPVLLIWVTVSARGAGDVNWPSFRGSQAGGIAEGHHTPTQWNVQRGENVRWKTAIPGLGHSCPVVWKDRIFVTTAVSGQDNPQLVVGLYGNIAPVTDDTKHSWRVYCLDKGNGRILWERIAHEGVPKIKRHTKSTHANSTPATDGKHVVAFFGSEGLYCYDFEGRLLWTKSFGVLDAGYYKVPEAQWEFGSSPIIHQGRVIVQCDAQHASFLAALSIKDGKELWRTPRNDVPTWSTPTVHEGGGRSQIIVNGYKRIGGYDFKTGQPLWWLRGGGDIPVPTPVVADDLIFITNAHGGMSPVYAIETTATGDISVVEGTSNNPHLAWSVARGGAYMQTPLVYRDYLYVCRDNGVLTCFEARTGDVAYRQRLGDGRTGFTASPVAADGKIYFTSEEGDVYVLKAAPNAGLLAVNAMNEVCMASPAISEGTLYFRTKGHLIAIGENKVSPAPGGK